MSITGLVRTARVFGPNVELRRTISSTLGEPAIRIHDRFVNRGNQPVPHCWLLHINFGYPLLEPEASTYCYSGKLTPRGDSVEWFSKRKDFRAAPKPQEAHRGTGEVFTYVDPKTDAKGMVLAGVVNRKRGFGVKVEFPQEAVPAPGQLAALGPVRLVHRGLGADDRRRRRPTDRPPARLAPHARTRRDHRADLHDHRHEREGGAGQAAEA